MDTETTETTTATPAVETETQETTEHSQDPVKAELEREQRTGRTEAEKAAYTLKKNAERVKELGLDPNEVLGITKAPVVADDETPVTMGMLRQRDAEAAQKTALQLAEDIADSNERELTKHYLLNRVRPSGNPQDDLRFARAAVNSVRNGQIASEINRRPQSQSYSTGAGAPAKPPEGEFKPTDEEARFMAMFKLSKEDILKAREKRDR